MANSTIGLIGRKLGMTQLFRADGEVVPVTVIETGPCTVTQVKTTAGRDHYDAIQLAFGAKKIHRANKPSLGHFKKAGLETPLSYIREFRLDAAAVANYELGKVITAADLFTEGEKIDVCGTSKGRGYAGVMKRHNFAGFERSHGAHEYFRHGGSIGTRLTPGMTLAGMPMSGHMGAERVTVQNLVVAKVDAERNLVFVHGGVPGPVGSVVTVRKSVKKA
ncbi:MAG: 50S ribosomal protein L3 [Myxococcota bacterium]